MPTVPLRTGHDAGLFASDLSSAAFAGRRPRRSLPAERSTHPLAQRSTRAQPELWERPCLPESKPEPGSPARAGSPALALACRPETPPGVWRANELSPRHSAVVSTGFAALDAELPGHGWPCGELTEVLCPQPAVVEWRLLGAALRPLVAAGQTVVLVGPPRLPHLPGLRHCGLEAKHLIWVQADAPAERLWCTEQLTKAEVGGALLAWLPQARPEQIRRLQVCAQARSGPVFLFRPVAVQHEASAAPLRVVASFGLDWELHIQILKRRGPSHQGVIALPSVPGGLEAVLTPRLRWPSRLRVQAAAVCPEQLEEGSDAVGRLVDSRC